MKGDDDTTMLTVKQVAEEMQVHERTVRGWVNAGELIPTWIGTREYRISRAALKEFIRKRSGPQPPADN